MKNIIIGVVLLLTTACATVKYGNTKTLKLVKADSQSYILGTQLANGKTTGKTYSMYFEHQGEIRVEKLWIKDINIDFEQVKTSESGSFRIRSTFYGGTKSNQHPGIKAPIVYEGEALVQYKENDEVKYFVVKEFKNYNKVSGI